MKFKNTFNCFVIYVLFNLCQTSLVASLVLAVLELERVASASRRMFLWSWEGKWSPSALEQCRQYLGWWDGGCGR